MPKKSEIEKQDREFFVGYLSMPVRLSTFNKALMVALLILAASVAVWLSSSQESVGRGQWDAFEKITLTGTLSIDPYPVLHIDDPAASSVLLVKLGKHSALDIAASFANQSVTVSGFPIKRGDWLMLELEDASDIEVTNAAKTLVPPVVSSLGNISLKGEIVDSKCFLGVMKPGAGKVHRACASLCLKGGIPPILVAKYSDNHSYAYVLILPDGTSASHVVAPIAGLPVEINGELEQRGDLLYLRMSQELPRQLTDSERNHYGDTLAMALANENKMHCDL